MYIFSLPYSLLFLTTPVKNPACKLFTFYS
nr:MAG TPA: hypothetical protein [Caudoviricetes sp.]DAW84151.1 MAG TPA: hypothetical protein [Bacteriophage sp.]DAY13683.1 MAG TPA: hypothetical protein [Bacteriophage sp.]